MPTPLSVTVMTIDSAASPLRTICAPTEISPCFGVNFSEFEIRLMTACVCFSTEPMICGTSRPCAERRKTSSRAATLCRLRTARLSRPATRTGSDSIRISARPFLNIPVEANSCQMMLRWNSGARRSIQR